MESSVVHAAARTLVPPATLTFVPGQELLPRWHPVLTFREIYPSDAAEITLPLVELRLPSDFDGRALRLDKLYSLKGPLPRSFYSIFHMHNLAHCAVFQLTECRAFNEMKYMRKSAYIEMKDVAGDEWQLHCKISRQGSHLLGYLVRPRFLEEIIMGQVNSMLQVRKLPLVLDLDDTIVRLVGNNDDRYVPEEHLVHAIGRCRTLTNGKQVVVAKDADVFLDWAKDYFDISICSLGEQSYVDQVYRLLDPHETRIKGVRYSARQEYDYIASFGRSGQAPRQAPAKNLAALYPYCFRQSYNEIGSGYSLPLILDDQSRAWPEDQHDNIVLVDRCADDPVWNVAFFPAVKGILHRIHESFFRRYDEWKTATTAGIKLRVPSVTDCYKQELRMVLRDHIALGISFDASEYWKMRNALNVLTEDQRSSSTKRNSTSDKSTTNTASVLSLPPFNSTIPSAIEFPSVLPYNTPFTSISQSTQVNVTATMNNNTITNDFSQTFSSRLAQLFPEMGPMPPSLPSFLSPYTQVMQHPNFNSLTQSEPQRSFQNFPNLFPSAPPTVPSQLTSLTIQPTRTHQSITTTTPLFTPSITTRRPSSSSTPPRLSGTSSSSSMIGNDMSTIGGKRKNVKAQKSRTRKRHHITTQQPPPPPRQSQPLSSTSNPIKHDKPSKNKNRSKRARQKEAARVNASQTDRCF